MKASGLSHMELLPDDVLLAVGGHLAYNDLVTVKGCSRRLARIARSCLCSDARWAGAWKAVGLPPAQRGWMLTEAIKRGDLDCVEATIRSGLVTMHDHLVLECPEQLPDLSAGECNTDSALAAAGDKSATAAAEEWTTALHVAVEQPTVLAFMLARLADVPLNIRLRDRTTPLMLACRFGDRCVRSVELLCDHGCDVYATDREGDDALWIAEYCCYHYDYGRVPSGSERVGFECARILREHGTKGCARSRHE